MEKKIRTIAFQVDDPEFIKQYEAQVKESGMKVKDYFVNLINNDIAKSQAQKSNSAPGTDITKDAQQIEQDNAVNDQQAVDTPVNNAVNNEEQVQPDNVPAPTENPDMADGAVHNQGTPEASEPEEMMNLFVKITKDQREALEHHKTESNENVGSVLNRLINGFLKDVREGNLSEEHNETFKYYSENVKSCDTKCSGKIPVKANQELADYLNEAGGASRNALIASLVHRDLHSQELAQTQELSL